MYKTDDYGENWSVFFKTEKFIDLHAVEFYDEKLGMFLGENNIRYRTLDGGKVWYYVDNNNEIIDYFDVKFKNYNTYSIKTYSDIINYSNDVLLMDIFFKEYIQDQYANYQSAFMQTSDWSNALLNEYNLSSIGQVPRKEYKNSYDINEEYLISEEMYNRLTSLRNDIVALKNYLEKTDNNEIYSVNIFYSKLLLGLIESRLALTFDKIVIENTVSNKKNNIKTFELEFKKSIRVTKNNEIKQLSIPLTISSNARDASIQEMNYIILSKDELKNSSKINLENALAFINETNIENRHLIFPSYNNTFNELRNYIIYQLIYLEINYPRNSEEYSTNINWNNVLNWINIIDVPEIVISHDYKNYLSQYDLLLDWTYFGFYGNLINQKILQQIDSTQTSIILSENDFKPIQTNDQRFQLYFEELNRLYVGNNNGLGLVKYKYNNPKYNDWEFSITSSKLINLFKAEALINTNGDKSEIASIINTTRVLNGGLSSILESESYDELIRLLRYEYIMEIGPLENGCIHWFNQRRFSLLREGSFAELPIPGSVLNKYNLPYYTFGGIEDTTTTPTDPTENYSAILYPLKNEVDVSLRPTIIWTKANNFNGPYNLEINGASQNLNISGITDTTFTLPYDLFNYKDYHVAVFNNSGHFYLNSFKTKDYKPEKPIVIFPLNETINTNTDINLIVELNQGTNQSLTILNGKINFQVFSDISLENKLIDTVINISSANVKLYYEYNDGKYFIKRNYIPMLSLFNLTYDSDFYWRTKLYVSSDSTDFSELSHFKTIDITQNGNNINLISPIIASDSIITPIKFEWTKLNNAESYTIELSLNSDFKESMKFNGIIENEFIINQALGNRTYFWKVFGYNKTGNEIKSSVSFFSTLMMIPQAPTWSPSEGEFVRNDSIIFTWTPVLNAETYNFQFSNDSLFSESIYIDELIEPIVKLKNINEEIGYWRVAATNYLGTSEWSETRTINNLQTSIHDEDINKYTFSLSQNYPNPYNPTTKIKYSIGKLTNVEISVFNTVGQKVATLINGKQSPGEYETTFSANHLSTGIYFYTLKTDSYQMTKKMVLIK